MKVCLFESAVWITVLSQWFLLRLCEAVSRGMERGREREREREGQHGVGAGLVSMWILNVFSFALLFKRF